jgi:NADH-quinone oxidoreductase subunit N
MSAILLKSYFGEIFLSFSILLQLVFNVRVVNGKKYNFPEVTLETFTQCFFILLICLSLIGKSNIEGSFYESFLISNESTKALKIFFIILVLFSLPLLYKSFKLQKLNFFEYTNLLLLSTLALLLMINASNLLSFYILMEMQALCFYILAAFYRTSVFSTESGLKYFVLGSAISGVYLLGVSFIYGSLGTLSLNDISLLLSIPVNNYDSLLEGFILIGFTLIVVTILFKIACYPFHFWAPDVYEGAPITSTIVFSIFPKLSLFSFFIKLLNAFVLANLESMSEILMALLAVGCLSTFIGTFLALRQKRLKRLIIYSSIAQTGFLVSGISLGTVNGFTDTYFFLFIYLITSVLIWGYFVNFYEGSSTYNRIFGGQVSPLYLTSLENLYKFSPIVAFPLVIIFFSIGGIPPLSGFLVKMLILYDLIRENFIFFSIALLFISAASIYYYIRVVKIVFFEPKKNVVSSSFFLETNTVTTDSFYFIVALFTGALIYFFFFPTSVLLLCQYIILL